mmetsp:Transcript_12769/g.40044  ORF Transcript_12769/g.40044 Transcript_12769/m.40044 type:complete len:267 (-) Transcript_12769:27-827(-)
MIAFCNFPCRSISLGYFWMIWKKSARAKTARSDSNRATMVAVRIRFSSKRQASPNHPPVPMLSLWLVRLVAEGSQRGSSPCSPCAFMPSCRCTSRYLPSECAPKQAASSPWTTKTTSWMSWPSSTMISPGVHCTQDCACASSPMKARLTPLKRGNCSTTLLRSARASSRCTVGVRSRKSSVSKAVWLLCCRRRRRLCCTRNWRSGATPRRRMNWTTRAMRCSSGSWKMVPMACEVTDTMVPKKTEATSMAKIAKSRESVPTGRTSP